MKVRIDPNRLTDSPYSKNLRNAFVLEDEEAVDQIVQEINNANPSSFLVSGYRGVGKTSFINRVIEKLGNDKISISLSLAKYEGYQSLIKKLIRHLYLSYSKVSKTDNNQQDELKFNLELLYERTFNEVTIQDKSSKQRNTKKTSELGVNLKKIVPFILLLAITLDVSVVGLIPEVWNFLGLFLSVLWAAVSSFNFKILKTHTKTNLEEVSRKSLYDDEIAEYHLFRTLDLIRDHKIEVIIVFDELDKIKSTKEVEEIIGELKALLLSGFANFFVVAGQGLYYQLEKSYITDDPIISSLFSKTIHVPFLRYSTLKKYSLNLVDNQDLKKNQVFNCFFDSLILEASRIPRKLSNEIRNILVWENGEAFVMIDEGLNDHYELESRLLQIITKIMDSDLRKITSNPVKQDFFIAQIHLWLNLIKAYKSSTFSVQDIVRQKKYDLDEYPESFVSQLVSLCELFFDRLLEEGVLEREPKENDIDFFKWKSRNIESTGQKENDSPLISADPNFVKEFIDLEHYVRGAYIDLIDGATWDDNSISLKRMLNELIEIGALKKAWANSRILNNIIDTRNKVVHGITIEKEDLDTIENSRFEISRLKAELIEDYTFYVSRKFLLEYKVSKESKGGFDFVAESNDHTIVFEVKYLRSGSPDSRNIVDIIDKFTNHLDTVSPNSYYVLFFYQPNGRKSFDIFNSKFFDFLDNSNPELKNRFFLFYNSEYRGDANTGRLEIYLGKVLERVKRDRDNNTTEISDIVSTDDYDSLIRDRAKREWPDDYSMQLDEIERQSKALEILQKGKPNDVEEEQYREVKDRAVAEWPNDFTMQLDEIERQLVALKSLQKGKPEDISDEQFIEVRQRAEREWPNDYVMRLDEQERQLESIRKLRGKK